MKAVSWLLMTWFKYKYLLKKLPMPVYFSCTYQLQHHHCFNHWKSWTYHIVKNNSATLISWLDNIYYIPQSKRQHAIIGKCRNKAAVHTALDPTWCIWWMCWCRLWKWHLLLKSIPLLIYYTSFDSKYTNILYFK